MNRARRDMSQFGNRAAGLGGGSVMLGRNLLLAVAAFALAQLVSRLLGVSGNGLFAQGLSGWPVVWYFGLAAASYAALLLLARQINIFRRVNSH